MLQCKLPNDDERMQMSEGEYFDYIRAGGRLRRKFSRGIHVHAER
jgi:hypothetical protein